MADNGYVKVAEMQDYLKRKYVTASEMKSRIEQSAPDLTAYVSKSALSDMSYATTDTFNSYLKMYWTDFNEGVQPYLWTRGLNRSPSGGQVYPANVAGSAVASSTDGSFWVGTGTMRNYVSYVLNSYVTNDALTGMSYLTSDELDYCLQVTYWTDWGDGVVPKLNTNGLTHSASSGNIAPKTLTVSEVDNNASTHWVGIGTLRNYVGDKLSSYVSNEALAGMSYATTTDLASYMPLSGGTMSGNITRTPMAGSWKNMYDKAAFGASAYNSDLNAVSISAAIQAYNGDTLGLCTIANKFSFALRTKTNDDADNYVVSRFDFPDATDGTSYTIATQEYVTSVVGDIETLLSNI